MTKREFAPLLDAAIKLLMAEIAASAKGGKYASGLASEGFAGGYMAALMDVDAMLSHGHPQDRWGVWAKVRSSKKQ